MTSLFARLKSGTEQEHRALENIIDPMKNFSCRDAYKEHISKTWALYHPLEADLAKADWAAIGIDFNARRKSPLLEEDMRVLGVPKPAWGGDTLGFDRASLDFAVGCLYVLEGATMGGQFISRHLATLGIGPASGARFFNGYGTKTGEMWKTFQTAATHYCVTEEQLAEALNGAKKTFESFREAMHREESTAHVT